jgi:GNAT superfamily N-acetyltransferase
MSSATPVHTIVRYREDLRPAADFLSYLGRSTATPSLYTAPYFRWKIGDNPFGDSAAYIRYRDGAPAAHCSIVAKPANPDLSAASALGELGDTHTHPDFQRQGHFSALGRYVIDTFGAAAGAPGALIYGLPNENALPGWTRSIGCAVHEQLGIQEVRRTPWAAGASIARIIADGLRSARGYLLRRHDDSRTAASIDAVWSSTARGALLLRKNADWWRWRYRSAPEHYETRILYRGDQPVAWMAWRTLSTRVVVVRRLVLCDVVAVSADAERAALATFLLRQVRPTDIVETWVQPQTPSGEVASRYGFVPVRSVPVIFERNPAYEQFAASGGSFRLSIGDTDNI